MASDAGPSRWPPLRDSWWVYGLAGAVLAVFLAAFLVRLHCAVGRCGGSPVGRLLDLERVGGLPRLLTTGLVLVVALLAERAARRAPGRAALWWRAVGVVGLGLALAKLLSVHAELESDVDPAATQIGALAATVLGLAVLAGAGHRWGVPAHRPVILALALYMAAALGLDVLTDAVAAARGGADDVTDSTAIFVEEFGEALGALVLVVAVWWSARAAQLVRQQ